MRLTSNYVDHVNSRIPVVSLLCIYLIIKKKIIAQNFQLISLSVNNLLFINKEISWLVKIFALYRMIFSGSEK